MYLKCIKSAEISHCFVCLLSKIRVYWLGRMSNRNQFTGTRQSFPTIAIRKILVIPVPSPRETDKWRVLGRDSSIFPAPRDKTPIQGNRQKVVKILHIFFANVPVVCINLSLFVKIVCS